MDSSAAPTNTNPWLIQGGMGIAISGWPLARAVARTGQLGVVSGTAIDTVFVRRLQDYGVDHTLQTVLDRFPLQSIVQDVLEKFASAKRRMGAPYKTIPMLTHRNPRTSQDLLVLASYVEVALAKEDHDGDIGINLLTKVQLPTLPTLFGAILAGVNYVLMGAGVPTHIPGILDRLSQGQDAQLPIDVLGATAGATTPVMDFDPAPFINDKVLRRPKFLGIVSGHVLANALAKRSSGKVDGFVVERPSAGGHNAPPRGVFGVDEKGNPEYGPRDVVDYEAMRALEVPFWIGGGVTTPEHVQQAFDQGATGVQVGTLFAYCDESGMEPQLRQHIINESLRGDLEVLTSLRASSTGYPFKVVVEDGTISDPEVYEHRERKCDLGYLREAYERPDGQVGYRCAAEPVSAFVRKGGDERATEGSTCLCNGLMATCGLGQVRTDGRHEPPIVTSGDSLNDIRTLALVHGHFSAADVVAHLTPWSRRPWGSEEHSVAHATTN
ncbi:MAG: nitronate monooxygenase [Acidimicrobiales bacterium]